MKHGIFDRNTGKFLMCYFDNSAYEAAVNTVKDMNARHCRKLPKIKDKKGSRYQVVERYLLKEWTGL